MILNLGPTIGTSNLHITNRFLEPYYVIILLQVGFYLTNRGNFSIYHTVSL